MLNHHYALKIVEIEIAQIRFQSQYCYLYHAREVENLTLKSYTMQRARQLLIHGY